LASATPETVEVKCVGPGVGACVVEINAEADGTKPGADCATGGKFILRDPRSGSPPARVYAAEMVAHIADEVGLDAPLRELPPSVAPLEAILVASADDGLQGKVSRACKAVK